MQKRRLIKTNRTRLSYKTPSFRGSLLPGGGGGSAGRLAGRTAFMRKRAPAFHLRSSRGHFSVFSVAATSRSRVLSLSPSVRDLLIRSNGTSRKSPAEAFHTEPEITAATPFPYRRRRRLRRSPPRSRPSRLERHYVINRCLSLCAKTPGETPSFVFLISCI